MSDGPPPPIPAGPPPPQPAPDTDPETEARKARSARTFAGWSIGCTVFAVLCCGGGTWVGGAELEKLVRAQESEVERIRATEDMSRDAGALLDVVGDRLRADARELPSTLPEAPPKDPWGNAIRYTRIAPDRATLTSAGPDGEFRTKDDVSRTVELR